MTKVRYRLVSWGDVALPVVESGDGFVWFWGESVPIPAGRTLESLELTDLPLRADRDAPAVRIGPVEVALGETRLDAWEAARRAGHWPWRADRKEVAAAAA